MENYKSCVDIENNADLYVYQGDIFKKYCGTLQLTYALEQSDQIYTLLCNAEGDAVKFSQNKGFLQVYEVVAVSKNRGMLSMATETHFLAELVSFTGVIARYLI